MSNTLWQSFEKDANKYTSHVRLETFEYSSNISLKYNYLFIETPKVACSTIKTILQKMELENPNFHRDNFEDIHDRDFSPLLKPSQVHPLDSFMNGTRLFKFCFSRNPYTRILSAYLDKIKRNRNEKKIIIQKLGIADTEIETEVSFSDFVDVILQQDIINMNPHWRTQYYQTFQNHINYDYIGKIETFDKDITNILKTINHEYKRYLSNEKRHATNANQLLSNYYNDKITEKIYNKYKKDFKYFNYDKNLPIL